MDDVGTFRKNATHVNLLAPGSDSELENVDINDKHPWRLEQERQE